MIFQVLDGSELFSGPPHRSGNLRNRISIIFRWTLKEIRSKKNNFSCQKISFKKIIFRKNTFSKKNPKKNRTFSKFLKDFDFSLSKIFFDENFSLKKNFFGDFFWHEKLFFFDRIFFKVHLKIQEIRFLRFPDRCGGSEKSYEPETKKNNLATFFDFLVHFSIIF